MPHLVRAVWGHRHPGRGDPTRSGGFGGCSSGARRSWSGMRTAQGRRRPAAC
jgi:hypothetical protein